MLSHIVIAVVAARQQVQEGRLYKLPTQTNYGGKRAKKNLVGMIFPQHQVSLHHFALYVAAPFPGYLERVTLQFYQQAL